MGKQIYDIDENIIRVAHTDSADPTRLAWETREDVEPILDSAKALREHVTPKDTFRHLARVPVTVFEQAIREGWADDPNKWRKWLNDSANAHLRVWEGRV